MAERKRSRARSVGKGDPPRKRETAVRAPHRRATVAEPLQAPAPDATWWTYGDPEFAAKEDERAGARQRTRETFAVVDEPAWLDVAKREYREIGLCLDVVSHHAGAPDFAVEPAIRGKCEKRLQQFVARTFMKPNTIELRMLMVAINDVVHRRTEVARRLVDGHGGVAARDPVVAVAYLFSLASAPRARAMLVHHEAQLARVVHAWSSKSPTPPTKWELLADLWAALTGDVLAAKSVGQVWKKLRRRPSE